MFLIFNIRVAGQSAFSCMIRLRVRVAAELYYCHYHTNIYTCIAIAYRSYPSGQPVSVPGKE